MNNQDLITIHNQIQAQKDKLQQLKGAKQQLIQEIKKEFPTFDENNIPEEFKISTQIKTNISQIHDKGRGIPAWWG